MSSSASNPLRAGLALLILLGVPADPAETLAAALQPWPRFAPVALEEARRDALRPFPVPALAAGPARSGARELEALLAEQERTNAAVLTELAAIAHEARLGPERLGRMREVAEFIGKARKDGGDFLGTFDEFARQTRGLLASAAREAEAAAAVYRLAGRELAAARRALRRKRPRETYALAAAAKARMEAERSSTRAVATLNGAKDLIDGVRQGLQRALDGVTRRPSAPR